MVRIAIMTVIALAFAACGDKGSGDPTGGHATPDKVVKPIATPAGGTYAAAQSVTLSTTTAGADIYYTDNGSTPTDGSTLYTGAITISTTTTLKAIAIKDSMTDSDILTETYTITIPEPKVIAAEWRNTLTYSGDYSPSSGDNYTGFSAVIGENTITLSGGTLGSAVTITGIYTEGGGPVTIKTPGEYTYVYKDGGKIGFMVSFTDGADFQVLCIGTYAHQRQEYYELNIVGMTLDLTGVPDFPAVYVYGLF